MALTFKKLSRHFAAEVTSPIELRGVHDPALLAGIRAGMDEYAVLVFRDQPFTDAEQLAFAERLDGTLHEGTGSRALYKSRLGNEAVADISNLSADGGLLTGEDRRRMYSLGNRLWHTDASFRDPAGRYSMLSAKIVPPDGADTEYADMRAAYDALPDPMKAKLEGLRVHHSIAHSRQTLGFEFSPDEAEQLKGAVHPLVRTIPRANRRSLYLASHASRILDWPVPEGRLLLHDLIEHATQREFVYRHAWRVGDLVIWDNRATMHRATPFEDTKHRRELHRVTTLDVWGPDMAPPHPPSARQRAGGAGALLGREPRVTTPLVVPGWRRNVWALSLTVFVAFVGFQFFSPFLPLYVQELGVSDPRHVALWSGVLAGVTPAVSGFLSPLFGRLADRFGRKMMMIRSLGGFVVIIAAMGLVTSVEQLFLARLLQGFFAGFTPMAMALASVSAPSDKVPVAIGMVQSAQLLSAAIGPAAGGYAASHFGIRYAFFVTAAMCALALVALIVLFREVAPGAAGASRRPATRIPLRDVLRVRYFAVVVAMLLVAQFLDRGLALLVPLQVAHLPGIEKIAATAGLIVSVAAVAATVSANLAARLSRGIPAAQLLMVTLAVGGVLCSAMALTRTWVAVLVVRTLVALALGGAITLADTLGAELVAPEQRGAAFGWLALGVQFGTAASPLVTGAVAALSLPGAYVVDGSLAIAAALLLAFGARGLRHRRGEP